MTQASCIKLLITLKRKVSHTRWQMHVQDIIQENAERRDPSTTHGRAIMSFYVARWQGVKRNNVDWDHHAVCLCPFVSVHPYATWFQFLKFITDFQDTWYRCYDSGKYFNNTLCIIQQPRITWWTQNLEYRKQVHQLQHVFLWFKAIVMWNTK